MDYVVSERNGNGTVIYCVVLKGLVLGQYYTVSYMTDWYWGNSVLCCKKGLILG